MEEIFGYIDGAGVTDRLQVLADLRKGEMATHRGIDLPMQISTIGPIRDNQMRKPTCTPDNHENLRGLGSSTGKARGTAWVVHDPTAATDVPDDPILVARETDPGWLFLMLSAKGMVVERGSMLSHTAITGRKFGIPTIVGVPSATTRIPHGALIEIDGASGVVQILRDAGTRA